MALWAMGRATAPSTGAAVCLKLLGNKCRRQSPEIRKQRWIDDQTERFAGVVHVQEAWYLRHINTAIMDPEKTRVSKADGRPSVAGPGPFVPS